MKGGGGVQHAIKICKRYSFMATVESKTVANIVIAERNMECMFSNL